MKWFARLIWKVQKWLGGGWKVCIGSWLVHATVVALVVLAFSIFGLKWYGYAAGLGFYVLREIEHWLLLRSSPWWDKLGDVAAPAVVGLWLCL
jgi:hypothetical protein